MSVNKDEVPAPKQTDELSDDELATVSGGPTAVENVMSRVMLTSDAALSLNFGTQAHGTGGGAG